MPRSDAWQRRRFDSYQQQNPSARAWCVGVINVLRRGCRRHLLRRKRVSAYILRQQDVNERGSGSSPVTIFFEGAAIAMTVRELSRLYYLNKLIDRNTEQLAKLEAQLQPGCQEITGMPRNPVYAKSTVEEIVIQVDDLRKRIQKEQIEYLRERRRIEKYISSVEDYQIRLIMLLRFVDLLTWTQVAQRIGGNNTEDSVRKACNRFLKKSAKS